MANKIKFKRGLKVNLPTLDVGEPAFTTDEKKLYVGTTEGNAEIGGDLSEIESFAKDFDFRGLDDTTEFPFKMTKALLETITINVLDYYGNDYIAVENGVAVDDGCWEWYDTGEGAFVLEDQCNWGGEIVWFVYEDNSPYGNENTVNNNDSWFSDALIQIIVLPENDKEYIFYKKTQTYNQEKINEIIDNEKTIRNFDVEQIILGSNAISTALYNFNRELDLPIILGTQNEPKENSKLDKYTNSYALMPMRIINGDYVEYHFDTSKWPFNEMVEVYEGGDVFIKIPKMYIKLEKDGDIIKNRYISDTKIDGTWISSPIFYDYNEGVELDYVLVGKYNGFVSGNNLYSQSGKEPTVSTTITNFRTYARNRGSGYQLFDMHIKFILETLYLIVFGNTHPDTYFPQGTWLSGKQNTGVLDGMEHHTGYYKGLDNYLMKFMGIENYFSNIYTWVDGVKTYQGNVYVCDNATNYNSDNNRTNYNNIGEVASSGYISELGTSQGLFSIPKATDGNNGEDYYQNNCYSFKTGTIHYTLYFGRYWFHNVYDGLFDWYGNYDFTYTPYYIGSRLVKKPL